MADADANGSSGSGSGGGGGGVGKTFLSSFTPKLQLATDWLKGVGGKGRGGSSWKGPLNGSSLQAMLDAVSPHYKQLVLCMCLCVGVVGRGLGVGGVFINISIE